MDPAAAQSFRLERKFLVDQLDEHDVISLLRFHPAMFKEIYPPRYINNIYLDDPMMGSFHDNVDGLSERRKIRVRWYGELFRMVEKPVLEFKLKRGLAGQKAQYPLSPFSLDGNFSEGYFKEVLRQSSLPHEAKSRIVSQDAVLLNRYYRWYFATPDMRFRVTIDSGLSYYHLHKYRNRFDHKWVDYQNIVVELKYQPEDDLEGCRISSGFPFRMTRSSKYVTGIEQVYL